MIHSNDIKQESLVERVIGASARNKFLSSYFTVLLWRREFMGYCTHRWMLSRTSSDVQVII